MQLDCTPWIPKRLALRHAQIHALVAKEAPSTHNPNDGNYDTGFSFAGWGACDSRVLIEIARRYDATGTRPRVIDYGAGMGFMARKIVVAGGELIAVERSRSLATSLQQNLRWASPFLEFGETLKSVSRIIVGDVLTEWPFIQKVLAGRHALNVSGAVTAAIPAAVSDESTASAAAAASATPSTLPITTIDSKQEPTVSDGGVDVVWAGNFIHMLGPVQVERFAKIIHDSLSLNGIAYVTAHTASSSSANESFPVEDASPSSQQRFFANKDAGMPFPGFMCMGQTTRSLHLDPSIRKEQIDGRCTLTTFPVPVESQQLQPGSLLRNPHVTEHLKNVSLGDFDMNYLERAVLSRVMTSDELSSIRGDMVTVQCDRIVHFFDIDVLNRVFTQAGLHVREAFYTDECQRRVYRHLERNDFGSKHYSVHFELERTRKE